MKNSLLVLSTLLLIGGVAPAMADPGRWDNHARQRERVQIYVDSQHGYGRGYGHHGNNYRGRSHGHGWGLLPWVATAAVGTTIYWANNQTPATTTVIVTPPVVVDPARVAYFCQTAQQYYPTVPTCNVPWQLVNY